MPGEDYPDFGPARSSEQDLNQAVAIRDLNTATSHIAKGIMSGMKIAADAAKGLDQRIRESGIYQKTLTEAVPDYNAMESEGATLTGGGLKGKHNTFIIMGRDRPGSEYSGDGATPGTHNGCIDIIAGMTGRLAREATDNPLNPFSQANDVKTNKSTQLDAARIYITQKAHDIDNKEYFNIARGSQKEIKLNRSAIVVKADQVRVVGRESVKIVTGGVYAAGIGFLIKDEVGGIDLIAGNNDADLQPLVLGNDLMEVIQSQLNLTKNLHSSVSTLYSLVVYFILCFIDPSGIAVSRLKSAIRELPQEFINLWTQELNFVIHELNYNKKKNPFAYNDFLSPYNHSN